MCDLTIITCNYNTPELVLNLYKSVNKFSKLDCKFIVINTSTDNISEKLLQTNNITYYNYRGGIHGEAVNLGLRKITTKYVLLLDSDVLIISDLNNMFNKFKSNNLTVMGNIVGDVAGKSLYPRVEPWFCFINRENLKKYKIEFFDRERTKTSKLPGSNRVYDIGSTMYEDVINNKLLIGNVNVENKRFIHFGGMSWRVQSYNPNDVDTDIDFGGTHPHEVLKTIGEQVRLRYNTEVLKYIGDE